MNTLLKQLLLGGSATALIAGASIGAAVAQDTSGALDIETVNSSASRIDLKGFEAPTPVTVIGLDTLNRDAKVNLGDEIRELPQVRGGFQASTGSQSGNIVQVDAGADTVALRNLGSQRNLVLFDHQRVTSSTIQEGFVDLSLIPTGLVQRVDVVTGGASASWGSDAVTGVVNIVINKTFEGFKGSAEFSDSTEVANPVYKASVAWGTSFLGGKGHTVLGADFVNNDQTVWAGDVARSHSDYGRSFVYNSAYCSAVSYPAATPTSGGTCSSLTGQPLLVYAYGVGSTSAVVGGLTSGNTAGTAGSTVTANSLKGVMFAGPDATPTQFNYGTIYNSSSCYNGCTNNNFGTGNYGQNTNPYHSGTYLSYTSYQITPDIKASVQLNYSRLTERVAGSAVNGSNRVIYADNPYLPDSIAQQFVCNTGGAAAAGAASTGACGTTLSNGYNPYTKTNYGGTLAQMQSRPTQTLTEGFEFSGNRPNPSPSATTSVNAVKYDWDTKCDAIYQSCGYANKVLKRGVFTLDGSLSDDWTWTAYIQHSDARIKQNIASPVQIRLNNALDAVRVTSGNVGTSGLPVGSIQCRALLNPAYANAAPAAGATLGVTTAGELAGCEPFDPFGEAEITNGARNYINPGLNQRSTGILGSVLVNMQQESGAASMQGVLPWKLPAGDIGVAFGGEWRLERQGQYNVDPRSALAMYPSGNFGANFEGKLHAEEGYLEVDAPILKNNIVEDLSVSAAGRLTNYSFSGLVETWKLGMTSQINDDFKLRMTWSYDIRAPDIWDLYAPGANSGNTCPSFIVGPTGSNGGKTNGCFAVVGGNPNVVPEKSQTLAAGIVMTPHWIDGLTASVDWYQIHLHGALYTPGQTEAISRCQLGDLSFCKLLVFDQPGAFMGAQGCGNATRDGCLGADTTSQIDYVRTVPVNAALFTTAGFDFAVAYGFDLFTGEMDVSFNGNYMYDFSRTQNGITFQGAGSNTTGSFYNGGPKFKGNLNLNYREGAWTFGTQFRITGDYLLDLGNEGNPLVPQQGVTYALSGGQTVATVGSGQRNLLTGASTNYGAMVVDTDLRTSYRWSSNITLFGAIDNVQDLPTIANGGQRRTYRLGARWNY